MTAFFPYIISFKVFNFPLKLEIAPASNTIFLLVLNKDFILLIEYWFIFSPGPIKNESILLSEII